MHLARDLSQYRDCEVLDRVNAIPGSGLISGQRQRVLNALVSARVVGAVYRHGLLRMRDNGASTIA